MMMEVDGERIYEATIENEDGERLDWGIPKVRIEGGELRITVSEPPEPNEKVALEGEPELRNRALLMTGQNRTGKDEVVRHPLMTDTRQGLEAVMRGHGEENTKTVYAVVEDGEIGVMTEHHSVVKSYVADSLVEGEGATIDVQTFEVDL